MKDLAKLSALTKLGVVCTAVALLVTVALISIFLGCIAVPAATTVELDP